MTATQIRQFHDLDLFVDMLAADPAHIARAKAKAKAVKEAQVKAERARQHRAVEQARVTRRMEITASSTVALAGLWTFLAAWLA
nr:MAG TPA: hypothetical protein [Caudoviricetes sp.]